MRKISEWESGNVRKATMPKEMSDWIDDRINTGYFANVIGKDGYMKTDGIAMKSRDCTVVVYPNWNCDKQFKNVVNKLR